MYQYYGDVYYFHYNINGGGGNIGRMKLNKTKHFGVYILFLILVIIFGNDSIIIQSK